MLPPQRGFSFPFLPFFPDSSLTFGILVVYLVERHQAERWLSGRKHRFAKPATGNCPRVRIPLSPPYSKCAPREGSFFYFCFGRGISKKQFRFLRRFSIAPNPLRRAQRASPLPASPCRGLTQHQCRALRRFAPCRIPPCPAAALAEEDLSAILNGERSRKASLHVFGSQKLFTQKPPGFSSLPRRNIMKPGHLHQCPEKSCLLVPP